MLACIVEYGNVEQQSYMLGEPESVDVAFLSEYRGAVRSSTRRGPWASDAVKSCSGARESLNLHNSGYRATPELRIGRLDVKFRALSF